MRRKQRTVFIIPYPRRLKAIVTIVMFIAVGAIITYELPSSKTWTEWSTPLSGRVIALDPGHGGKDGGAESRDGVIEKDITLAISLYLRDYLQQAGAVVVMTREEDRDLADEGLRKGRKRQDLERRVNMVSDEKADMFLSIHLNSIPSPKWYGAQSFYDTNDMEGKRLAVLVQEELTGNLNNTSRKAKAHPDMYLLKSLSVPRALVEVGFLSNPEEARLLATEAYQKQIAAAIYRGILRYSAGEQVGSS